MKKGFSLIELMIAITIIAVMTTLGISAYSKGSDKQIAKNSGETIVSILTENQKQANIGHEDCTGKYLGQQISISSGSNTITAVSLCTISVGEPLVTSIDNITFNSSTTMVFNPLSQGVTDASSITFTGPNGSIYTVRVDSSGTIEYSGVQK